MTGPSLDLDGITWRKVAAVIALAPFAIALSPAIAAMFLVSWAFTQLGVDAWE